MPSRIYNRDNRNYILTKRKTMKRQIAINPKYYPTKTLRAFRDNNYCGVDGLDREQYKDEIDSEYFRRSNLMMERDSKTIEDAWEEWFDMMDNRPPEFPYIWDETTQSYLEF